MCLSCLLTPLIAILSPAACGARLAMFGRREASPMTRLSRFALLGAITVALVPGLLILGCGTTVGGSGGLAGCGT